MLFKFGVVPMSTFWRCYKFSKTRRLDLWRNWTYSQVRKLFWNNAGGWMSSSWLPIIQWFWSSRQEWSRNQSSFTESSQSNSTTERGQHLVGQLCSITLSLVMLPRLLSYQDLQENGTTYHIPIKQAVNLMTFKRTLRVWIKQHVT